MYFLVNYMYISIGYLIPLFESLYRSTVNEIHSSPSFLMSNHVSTQHKLAFSGLRDLFFRTCSGLFQDLFRT